MESLIDGIYECALLPELWPGVLDRMAAVAGARGGLLFAVNRTVTNWTASDVSRERMDRFVNSDMILRTQRFTRLMAVPHAGFVRDNDVFTHEEMAQDPIYRDFLWPAGMGCAAATAIRAPTGDVIVLSLERERARGPVDLGALPQLDSLRPHIARSALLSARLQLERAKIAAQTLSLLGLPALVLDAGGRVMGANGLAEALDHITWRAKDRIDFKDAAADAIYHRAVATLTFDDPGLVRSFATRQTPELAGMIAHLVPIRGTARDIFVRCAAILVLMPVTMPQAPPVDLVQSLFDLTPAEARVARSLASGDTVDEIATQGGVSSHTVRSQVRGILGKTGCRRQAEMMALLSGMPATRLNRPALAGTRRAFPRRSHHQTW